MIVEFIIGFVFGIDIFFIVDKIFGIYDIVLMVMGILFFIFIGYWLDRRV